MSDFDPGACWRDRREQAEWNEAHRSPVSKYLEQLKMKALLNPYSWQCECGAILWLTDDQNFLKEWGNHLKVHCNWCGQIHRFNGMMWPTLHKDKKEGEATMPKPKLSIVDGRLERLEKTVVAFLKEVMKFADAAGEKPGWPELRGDKFRLRTEATRLIREMGADPFGEDR